MTPYIISVHFHDFSETLEWGMCVHVFSAWLFLTWKLSAGCTKKSDMLCADVGSPLNKLNTNRESDVRAL